MLGHGVRCIFLPPHSRMPLLPSPLANTRSACAMENSQPVNGQLDLFGATIRMQWLSNLYESVDTLREKYGKHTVFLGASFLAHQSAQHEGERGHLPERRRQLLPGETTRKRLGIPMFLGEVH